ncbi:MAG: hypothetical protein R3A51_15235 [Nannocystaceae bacterium]
MTPPWKAIIDIGSNTVLMLIARRHADGRLEIAEDRALIARLGEGAGASGQLSPTAIARALAALERHRDEARSRDAAITAVTTEGVRMATNAGAFLEPATRLLGAPVRVISGEEEAQLSYLSVARERGPGPLRVIDIGGASTELVAGDGEAITSIASHRIGSVRLHERLLAGADDPIGDPAAIDAVYAAAREALAAQPLPPYPELHGLAGTVTTAAALLLDLPAYDRDAVDGARFSPAQVEALRDRLAAMTVAARCQHPCLPRGRGDVIVAGLTILLAALAHCGASTLVCRDRGLRYALV